MRVGDRVMSLCVPAWQDGSLSRAAMQSTLGGGTCDGVLAEYVVAGEDALVPVPAGWSHAEAATLPCAGVTAWHALFEEGTPAAGATVLTLGTGGVSMFAIQFAAQAGLRVMATSGHEEKIARLHALGVTATMNYRQEAAWGDRARAMSGGEGVDQVIEVGGQGTLEQSLRAVRPGGTVSLIGNVGGAAAVNLMPILMRNIRLQGVFVGSRAMVGRMTAALASSRLRPIVDRAFAFDDAPAAFEYMAEGRHVGKVVIVRDA